MEKIEEGERRWFVDFTANEVSAHTKRTDLNVCVSDEYCVHVRRGRWIKKN